MSTLIELKDEIAMHTTNNTTGQWKQKRNGNIE